MYIIKPVWITLRDDIGEYKEEIYALFVGGALIETSYSTEYLFNIALEMGADYYEILITRKVSA